MQKVKTNTQEFTSVPEKEIALQREHLSPGDCVSGVYALWWWQSCSQSCFEEGLYAPSGFIEGIRHTRRQVILLVMKTNNFKLVSDLIFFYEVIQHPIPKISVSNWGKYWITL